jgi:hypothetical protein
MEQALEDASEDAARLQIGYVIVNPSRASPQLVAFARSALSLKRIATEAGRELYIVQ